MQALMLCLFAQIDFWGTKKPQSGELWTEPVLGEDGSVKLHTPPPEVVKFLQAPSEESAAQYLSWQRERLKRIKTAQQFIEMVIDGELAKEVRGKVGDATLFYFSKPGCPFCLVQDKILKRLETLLPDLSVKRVSDTEEFKAQEIETVPALILSVNGKRRRFDGVTHERQILQAMKGGLDEHR